jgi:hypothetical protein
VRSTTPPRTSTADRIAPTGIVSAYSQAVQAGRGLLHAVSSAVVLCPPETAAAGLPALDLRWASQRAPLLVRYVPRA